MKKNYSFDSIKVITEDNIIPAICRENVETVDLSKYPITTGYEYMFYQNNYIKTLILPKTIKEIKSYFIYYCENLQTLIFKGTTSEWNDVTKRSNAIYKTRVTEVQCSNGVVTL